MGWGWGREGVGEGRDGQGVGWGWRWDGVGLGREGVGVGCGSRDSACSNVIVTLILIMLTCSSDPANPNPDHNYVTRPKPLILI